MIPMILITVLLIILVSMAIGYVLGFERAIQQLEDYNVRHTCQIGR